LQNVWHEVEYRLDVCRATNEAHIELAQGMKKLLELLFSYGVRLIFVWLLRSYQQIYVFARIICNHPVFMIMFTYDTQNLGSYEVMYMYANVDTPNNVHIYTQ
jgi:hypothetical protein